MENEGSCRFCGKFGTIIKPCFYGEETLLYIHPPNKCSVAA